MDNIVEKKRQEIKKTKKAFCLDLDGTLIDAQHSIGNLKKILQKIIFAKIIPIIITARGASIIKMIEPFIVDLYTKNKKLPPFFLGTGNGTTLFKYGLKIKEIYKNVFSEEEVSKLLDIWKIIFNKASIKESQLNKTGIEQFNIFLKQNWDKYIPKNIFKLAKKFNGACFAEESKITIVLPNYDENKQRKILADLQKEIDNKIKTNKYLVKRGNSVYAHITRTFGEDPKLFALNKSLDILKLKPNEVFVCGDMPFDNDKGILVDSHLPYTFTNNKVSKPNKRKPPFFIPSFDTSPVGSVYKTIDYLLS